MIVPSIDLMQGRAVQLRRGRDFVLDGGDPLARLEEFAVAGELAVVDLDAALGKGSNAGLIRQMVRRAPCRVGGGIRDLDTARAVRAAGEARVTAAGGITTATEIAELDRIGADAQVGMALYTGRLPLGEAVAAPLAKPVDSQGGGGGGGVWPTVVCDEWGHTLGLVWSTRESLTRAIAERRGIYWSRSRQALWEKGATSGNTQALVRVDLDCDRDALRFTVRQCGAGFCHLERRSCWPSGFDLDDLARTISERAARPEPGSGTAKLLADPTLLAAKLVEEAEELARADARGDVVHDAADRLYLTLVAVVRGGGTLAEVVAQLSRRRGAVTGRPIVTRSKAAP